MSHLHNVVVLKSLTLLWCISLLWSLFGWHILKMETGCIDASQVGSLNEPLLSQWMTQWLGLVNIHKLNLETDSCIGWSISMLALLAFCSWLNTSFMSLPVLMWSVMDSPLPLIRHFRINVVTWPRIAPTVLGQSIRGNGSNFIWQYLAAHRHFISSIDGSLVFRLQQSSLFYFDFSLLLAVSALYSSW